MVTMAPNAAAEEHIPQHPAGSALSTIVARAGIFQSVDPAAVAMLMTYMQPVLFARRQQIYGEGEAGDNLYIVTSGKVKLGRRSADGRNHLLAIVGPSEMFGELSIFDPGPRTATATALTTVDAVTMDRDVVRAWVSDRPAIAERLLRVLARRLRRTDNDLSDLIFTDVGARAAKQLLQLAQRFGVQENGATRLTHDLTQEEFAQLIGASRETVNKVLADFTQRGWIRLNGQSMLITEFESLGRRAHRTAALASAIPSLTDGEGDVLTSPATRAAEIDHEQCQSHTRTTTR